MEEEQPLATNVSASGPEDPAAMEAATGQPANAAPQFAYQNQPNAATAMGNVAVNQPTSAPQYAYQNQPIVVNPMGVAAVSQPANSAPQFIYQNYKPNGAVGSMGVAMSQQPANAPRYAYQNQPTVGNAMGVAASQPTNNAPQFVHQNQQTVGNAMGVAVSQQPANNAPQYAYQNQPTVVNAAMGVAASQSQAANAPQYAGQIQQTVVNNGQFCTGLMDCFDDPSLCCLTFWFPCITFGRIAEIVDQGLSSCGTSGAIYAVIMGFTCLQFIYSWTYRQKMRVQLGMPEDTFGDICIHFWCEVCVLVQEHRELQLRGYDVALGWHGNMARQNQQVMFVPPSVPGGMTR